MRRITLCALMALSTACAPSRPPTVVALEYRAGEIRSPSFSGDGLPVHARVVHLDASLAATTEFAGRELSFEVLDSETTAPRLAVNGETQGIRFELQKNGYVQAFLDLPTTRGVSESYLFIAVYHHDTPWVFMQPLGSWRGTVVSPDGEELGILLQDWDVDGDYSAEEMFVDADSNGRFARCERVAVGETVRIGELVLQYAGADAAGESIELHLGGGAGASEARDLLAELAVAPLVGNALPRLQGRLADGSAFDTDEMRGDVLLVMFAGWSATTWQADHLREALRLTTDRQRTVLALQEEPEAGAANAPDWTWAHEEAAHVDALWVTGFPTVFLVDRDGTILTRRFQLHEEARDRNLTLLATALSAPPPGD